MERGRGGLDQVQEGGSGEGRIGSDHKEFLLHPDCELFSNREVA